MIRPKIFFVNNCLGGLKCEADICSHREAENKEQSCAVHYPLLMAYYNSKILVFLREHLCYLYVRTAAKIAAQHPFYTSTRNTERVSWPS